MRIRLLIDTMIDDSQLTDLAECIADQTPVQVAVFPERDSAFTHYTAGGRLMGALPVFGNEP
jgi:hypothetical protein